MDYFETVARWAELQHLIPRLQAEERALREGLFIGTFPNPAEGVNSVTFPDGRVLKGTHVINRSVKGDPTSLPKALREAVINFKPELRVGAYKKLEEAERKKVDSIIEAKPGLCKLELILPAQED